MPGPVEHRSSAPIIRFMRDVFRGRKVVLCHRWLDEQAKRTQPPPNVPGGPYHKTSQIYYYLRDARREVQQPTLIASKKMQIGTEKEALPEKKHALTPGKTYNWGS